MGSVMPGKFLFVFVLFACCACGSGAATGLNTSDGGLPVTADAGADSGLPYDGGVTPCSSPLDCSFGQLCEAGMCVHPDLGDAGDGEARVVHEITLIRRSNILVFIKLLAPKDDPAFTDDTLEAVGVRYRWERVTARTGDHSLLYAAHNKGSYHNSQNSELFGLGDGEWVIRIGDGGSLPHESHLDYALFNDTVLNGHVLIMVYPMLLPSAQDNWLFRSHSVPFGRGEEIPLFSLDWPNERVFQGQHILRTSLPQDTDYSSPEVAF